MNITQWGYVEATLGFNGTELGSMGLSRGSVGLSGSLWGSVGVSGDQCAMYIHPFGINSFHILSVS